MESEVMKAMLARRSVRSYTGDPVPMEALNAILEAGMLSPSSRGARPWELIVIRDKQVLIELSSCRQGGAARMLVGADAAIVVVGDGERSDVWTEDCSIVLSNMHLMASSLGIGSCWIQGRNRTAMNGDTTEDYVQKILRFPSGYRLEAILSLGIPEKTPEPHRTEDLPYGKIHIGKW